MPVICPTCQILLAYPSILRAEILFKSLNWRRGFCAGRRLGRIGRRRRTYCGGRLLLHSRALSSPCLNSLSLGSSFFSSRFFSSKLLGPKLGLLCAPAAG